MDKRRLYVLEPSKVGTQHITLIEGYLKALTSSRTIREQCELILCASPSTLANLTGVVTSRIQRIAVFVMNPEKRRLVLKTLVELCVVLRFMVRLCPGDLLLVTCVLPTTLWLLEFSNRILRRRGVHVVLHGEIEGLFETRPQSILSIGYWAMRWLRSRPTDSRIRLIVLDDFIRDRLVAGFPRKLSHANISVIHHPVIPQRGERESGAQEVTACFVGYRTRKKSFETFSQIAALNPSVVFVAIGGGKVENVRNGAVKLLRAKDAYLEEIAGCSVALFPYISGYTCSLSAAALDALSAGVWIVALDRPFFRSLETYLGPETVRVSSSIAQLSALLADAGAAATAQARASRLERVAMSKYGLPAVQGSFENLVAFRE
jgi:hypothetical protein